MHTKRGARVTTREIYKMVNDIIFNMMLNLTACYCRYI